jgi:hypothetical protein
MCAAAAGVALIAGAAGIATAAQAQPYGDSYGPPPPYGRGYERPYDDGRYGQPYGYRGEDPVAAGMAALGAVLGLNLQGGYGGYGYGVPVDRYGPDPNGMIGPDGRRIKCKLRRTYDRGYGGYVTRRECWSR